MTLKNMFGDLALDETAQAIRDNVAAAANLIAAVRDRLPAALENGRLPVSVHGTVALDPAALIALGLPSQITDGSGDGAGDSETYVEELSDGTVLNWTDVYNTDGTIFTHTYVVA